MKIKRVETNWMKRWMMKCTHSRRLANTLCVPLSSKQKVYWRARVRASNENMNIWYAQRQICCFFVLCFRFVGLAAFRGKKILLYKLNGFDALSISISNDGKNNQQHQKYVQIKISESRKSTAMMRYHNMLNKLHFLCAYSRLVIYKLYRLRCRIFSHLVGIHTARQSTPSCVSHWSNNLIDRFPDLRSISWSANEAFEFRFNAFSSISWLFYLFLSGIFNFSPFKSSCC